MIAVDPPYATDFHSPHHPKQRRARLLRVQLRAPRVICYPTRDLKPPCGLTPNAPQARNAGSVGGSCLSSS